MYLYLIICVNIQMNLVDRFTKICLCRGGYTFAPDFVCQYQDIRGVLTSNPKGHKILAEYDRHRTLSSESRQTLVKIMVAQLVHDCGS